QKVWFDEHGDDYPLLVGTKDDQVVGWAALSSWSDRCSYKTTGEVSIYVAEQSRGQGFGNQLLEALIKAGRQADIHLAVARIAEGNPASVALHEKYGFKISGKMSEAGYKFGNFLDVIFMEQLLDGSRK
ncbi:GNAT family N-acetyltransferase, partial [Candidatus Neomarinimicrobiota bacterium]